MGLNFKCRKCRNVLFREEHLTAPAERTACESSAQNYQADLDASDTVTDENSGPSLEANGSCTRTLWYVEVEDCPEWIHSSLIQTSYTRGKLSCPNCEGRVGGFDFVTPVTCSCGRHPVPPIRITKSRVDFSLKSSSPVRVAVAATSKLRASAEDFSQTSNSKKEDVVMSHEPGHKGASSVASVAQRECAEQNGEITDQQTSRPQSFAELDNSNNSAMNSDTADVPEVSGLADNEHENDESMSDSAVQELEPAEDDPADNRITNELAPLQDEENAGIAEKAACPEDMRDLDALTCSVCLDLFFHPQGCDPCRHVFCDPCLRRLKSSTPLETCCPLCRTVILKCSPREDLGEKIRTEFPSEYKARNAVEKRVRRHLPSLPSSTSHSLRAFLRHRRRARNNSNNTLTVIAQFAFFVLLVMFAFTVFATTVGYVLWYLLELFMDVTLDLKAAVSNFWDRLYQAMIVWSINGHIPPAMKEMLSNSIFEATNTYNKFLERMKELWNGGDQYRHQFMGHLRYHMTNGTNEFLSKVREAQVANYILLACLTTVLLYKLARYVQRLQEFRHV